MCSTYSRRATSRLYRIASHLGHQRMSPKCQKEIKFRISARLATTRGVLDGHGRSQGGSGRHAVRSSSIKERTFGER
jgi:hypothetical protein